MALSELQLINAALAKLGAAPITSLSDGSATAEMTNALYPLVRDAFLAAYPWGFLVTQVVLNTPVTPPIADYDYAFNLPGDHLRTLSVGAMNVGAGVAYRIQNNRIETNESAIILTYLRRVTPGGYPPHIDAALAARLAAELCLPITENPTRAEVLIKISEQEFARARSIDAQQDTPAALKNFPLIDARG